MVNQETQIRKRRRNDLYIFRSYNSDINNANKEWLEMIGKGWWMRLQFTSWWSKFMEWRLGRQSKKFAAELKRKNYVPRQPWDNGIWK